MGEKEFYKVSDIARKFGVSSVSVRNWIKKGKLKAFVTPGGHCRIKKKDYEEFIKKYQK